MNKSDLVIDKVDKSSRMLDEVIEGFEDVARILDQDMSDSFLECLGNVLLENGLGETIVQAIKERLLINRRKRETMPVKVLDELLDLAAQEKADTGRISGSRPLNSEASFQH